MGGVQQRALGREREETGQSPSIRHSRASPDAVITASHQGGNCLHHFKMRKWRLRDLSKVT